MHSIGTMIQHYKVLELMGQGGMGEVYLCEDTTLNRQVAIKVLMPSLTQDAGFSARFRHEAQLQAKLVHPNIIGIYSFFEEFGESYIVMEYAQGRTLRSLIETTGPIPEARAKAILIQVLQGLAYAHARDVVHRDIKPANIIIDSEDNVKILDFGIARLMGEQGMTQTGQTVGTISYMSPEQVQNPKGVDARTDIYSLGVTFFEMLSGKLPYNMNTDSDYAVMNQIVSGPVVDPRTYYPHISDHTVNILSKMLMRDRIERYATAKAVLQDLGIASVGNSGIVNSQFTATQPPQIRPQAISGQVYGGQPGMQRPVNIPTYMAQAILATIFCCLPFGIVAIVNASKVSGLIANGDFENATKCSLQAKKWVNWAVIAAVIYVVFYGIIAILGGS